MPPTRHTLRHQTSTQRCLSETTTAVVIIIVITIITITIITTTTTTVYNKKLSYRKEFADQLRTRYVEGIYSSTVALKSRLGVTQGHWKWHHSVDRVRVPISVP